MILPGVIASSGGVASSYESIATVTVGSGGASSVSFSSIPSTFTHLQVRGIAKSTNTASVLNGFYVQYNSDTSANYSWHQLYGYNNAASSGGASSTSYMYPGYIPLGDSAVNYMFSAFVFDVLDYSSTSKQKTLRMLSGMDLNYTNSWPGAIVLGSGLWKPSSIAAISSIQITTSTGNFAQYSSFALYGVKG